MMPSMDEVNIKMQRFELALEKFKGTVTQSTKELVNTHDAVRPLWDDTMYKEYKVHWDPLSEFISLYRDRILPEDIEHLQAQLRHLRRYLNGS